MMNLVKPDYLYYLPPIMCNLPKTFHKYRDCCPEIKSAVIDLWWCAMEGMHPLFWKYFDDVPKLVPDFVVNGRHEALENLRWSNRSGFEVQRTLYSKYFKEKFPNSFLMKEAPINHRVYYNRRSKKLIDWSRTDGFVFPENIILEISREEFEGDKKLDDLDRAYRLLEIYYVNGIIILDKNFNIRFKEIKPDNHMNLEKLKYVYSYRSFKEIFCDLVKPKIYTAMA